MSEMEEVPDGFESMERGGPYFMMIAPAYRRVDDQQLVFGLRIDSRHTNMHGNAHGGMLVTLVDGALHDNLIRGRVPGARITTVHMSVDFLEPVRQGDWLEAHVRVSKQGRTLCFAECELRVGAKPVLRAGGVFAETR